MPEPSAIDAKSSAVQKKEEPVELYAARKKLHVRSVQGVFTRWRWILVWVTQLIFYCLPWFTWNGRQAVLFHLTERKFYLGAWVFWPQDVFYLAILLIISAYVLFFFTAIAGRLWCGYACPQTVYTEIFMWIEEKIEGNFTKRRKLEQSPLSARKFLLRSAKFATWALFSLWTGFTFVSYFSPLQELLQSTTNLGFGGWEGFWILFYGGFTYVFAGVLREQVCKYMCPYARFQSVMFDSDTLVVTYDPERGEPRGKRKKGLDPRSIEKGDCIDCHACVQVCPTGIDIREGLQYECIGCAACIDACDRVMGQMNYAPGLIRYSTENAMQKHWGAKEVLTHIRRPRTILYGAVLAVAVLGMIVGLMTRQDLRINIIRDRATLAREVSDGLIENVYRLQIMNMVEYPREIKLAVSGLEGVRLDDVTTVQLPPLSTEAVTVHVRAPVDAAAPGAHPISLEGTITTGKDSVVVRESTTFFLPH